MPGIPFPKTTIDRSTVGVFLPNNPIREPYRLSRDYARRELIAVGMACWTNHAKDIRLNFTPELELRGESCNVKVRLIERAIDGSFVADFALRAWNVGRHVLAPV